MRAALFLVLGLLLCAAPVHAHIELEAASPAEGARLDSPPHELRLRFSGYLEPSYTSVQVTAPDGSQVATGRVQFVDGSDRAFTVALPPLSTPGEYTVAWRTAGADGHVLTGSYSFALTGPAEPGAAPDTLHGADTATAAPAAPMDHGHDPGGAGSAAGPRASLARLLHFAALTLLGGALAFRVLLLPRLRGMDADTRLRLRRGAWRMVAVAAIALVAAAVLRLWLQSVALHGAERAWSSPLLSMMLADTSWGRAWVLQAFLLSVLGASVAWARPTRDRAALVVGVPAAIALTAIPALTGHAAGAGGAAWLTVANDTLHVLAMATWIGTLFLLTTLVLPVLLARAGADDAADAVNRFSPLALTAATVVILTGAVNTLMHIDRVADLTGTQYGRVLLLKVALVALVLLGGFINWRVLQPRLSGVAAVRRLRVSAAVELALAGLVLVATAVLTGLPRP